MSDHTTGPDEKPKQTPSPAEEIDEVDEAGEESFPASDPPSITPHRSAVKPNV